MTHHTRVLPEADQIIVLKDGVITEVLGSYKILSPFMNCIMNSITTVLT